MVYHLWLGIVSLDFTKISVLDDLRGGYFPVSTAFDKIMMGRFDGGRPFHLWFGIYSSFDDIVEGIDFRIEVNVMLCFALHLVHIHIL